MSEYVDEPWTWWLFAWFVVGALILCLAGYGAWTMFAPGQCNLGVGALL
jgi:hypothetical protein